MATGASTKPVEDSVGKINNEVAVGADLDFQRRWWRFEKAVWIIFICIVALDLLGVFGRGFLADGRLRSSDGSLEVTYERVQRFRTPSIMTVQFGEHAVREGKAQLWVSQSVVKPLGNQRIIPQPASSVLKDDGVLYTFPVHSKPPSVAFALEPGSAGVYNIALRVPGSPAVQSRIVVVP